MIAIVPARAGSKSIINKNLAKLGKYGLTDRAIRIAKEIGIFSKIILSTDIPILLKDYQKDKGVELRERPTELCQDESAMSDVVKDALEHFKVDDEDWIWLLQPTSPFRKPIHFKKIVNLIYTGDFNSIISVKNVGGNHPSRQYTMKGDRLYPLRFNNFENRQKLLPIFIRNGCFYVTKAKCFKENNSFFSTPCYGLVMEDEESVNIDSQVELDLCRVIQARRNDFGL